MSLPFAINKIIERGSFASHYITEQVLIFVNNWNVAVD
jgi:hypothetical protein